MDNIHKITLDLKIKELWFLFSERVEEVSGNFHASWREANNVKEISKEQMLESITHVEHLLKKIKFIVDKIEN